MTTTADGDWGPGIGDPSLIGWITVGAYCGTALLALYCARLSSEVGADRAQSRRLTSVWAALAALFFALGINKQLDLQSLGTVVARRFAQGHGLYEQRRFYQQLFIGGFAVCAALSLIVAARWLRRELPYLAQALTGSVLVVLFVLVRASSFHHVDFLLASKLGGWRLNWIFELGGIGLVAAAAVRFARRAGKRS